MPIGTGAEIQLSVTVTDAVPPFDRIAGASACICEWGDVTTCDLASSTTPCGTTDARGVLHATLPYGFDGYGAVTGFKNRGLVPFLVVAAWPVTVSPIAIEERTFTVADFAELHGPVAAIEAGKGHLYLTAQDCHEREAAGIAFVLDPPEGVPYYGRPPDAAKTATALGQSGGGFLNLTPGQRYCVSAIRRDTLECVAAREAYVRAGSETQIHLLPRYLSHRSECPCE